MKPEKDNTFCYFPFSQLALKEWKNNKGILNAAPCCNAIRPENDDPLNVKSKLLNNQLTPEEIFYSDEMNNIRNDMLQNKRSDTCKTCWNIEDSGSKSYRLFSIPPGTMDKNNDFDHNNPRLQSIDFGFGENCNLRCRMCHPDLSNKLRIDYNFFVDNNIDTKDIFGWDYKITPKNSHNEYIADKSNIKVYNFDKNQQWQNILDNIHNLRTIKATGGETTLTEGFNEFIDYAIATGANKNLVLEFHTNATKFTDAFVDKIMKFKYCHISLSIDSIGKNYEYIRYPMKWDILTSSLNNLINKWHDKYKGARHEKRISMDLTSVLSVYNAHYLYDLYSWWKDTLYSKPLIETAFFIDKIWPEDKFINVKYLGKKEKNEVLDGLYRIKEDNLPKVEVDHIINYIKDNMHLDTTKHKKQMIKEITIFDKSRNQNYKDYMHPSVINYLES